MANIEEDDLKMELVLMMEPEDEDDDSYIDLPAHICVSTNDHAKLKCIFQNYMSKMGKRCPIAFQQIYNEIYSEPLPSNHSHAGFQVKHKTKKPRVIKQPKLPKEPKEPKEKKGKKKKKGEDSDEDDGEGVSKDVDKTFIREVDDGEEDEADFDSISIVPSAFGESEDSLGSIALTSVSVIHEAEVPKVSKKKARLVLSEDEDDD